MPEKRDQHDITRGLQGGSPAGSIVDPLVTVEIQRESDLFSGHQAERIFVKLYVAARESGLLAEISDRDWKTLCTLATYMDGTGYCYPSQTELAKAMGCSRQMANERVRSLAEFRFRDQQVLLVVKKQRSGKGKWARNGYRVLPISRLRIYDGAELRTQTDTGNDTSDKAQSTVSRNLDTVIHSEPTVSSPTVTVPLDTNENQSLEQEDFELSKFEGHRQIETMRDDGGPGARRARGDIHATNDSAADAPPEQIMPLGEVLRLRAQASAAIGSTALALRPTHASPATPHGPRGRPTGTTEEREQLRAYLGDFCFELGDEAPLSSTLTRVRNIFEAAKVHPGRWGDYLYQARSITQEHTVQIRKAAGEGATSLRRKNKIPYFLATLEQLVGLRPAPVSQALGVDEEE